jgi:hypothetical protein
MADEFAYPIAQVEQQVWVDETADQNGSNSGNLQLAIPSQAPDREWRRD